MPSSPIPSLSRATADTLAWESLDLRSEPGLMLTIYTAEPGSPSAEALALLASWSPVAAR